METGPHTLIVEEFQNLGHDELDRFLQPSSLADRFIICENGDSIPVGPRFLKGPAADHVQMSGEDVENAVNALAQHPERRLWKLVLRSIRSRHSFPCTAQRLVEDCLELCPNQKESLAACLSKCRKSDGFVLRIAAAFAAELGMPAFPTEAIAEACGRHLSRTDRTESWLELVLGRISAVYWLDASKVSRLDALLVSGILGVTKDGRWFYYRDANPGLTAPKYPSTTGPYGGCTYGGTFHQSYIASAGSDIRTLLRTMDKRDVNCVVRSVDLLAKVEDRAEALWELYNAVGSVKAAFDSVENPDPSIQTLRSTTFQDFSIETRRALAKALFSVHKMPFSAGHHSKDLSEAVLCKAAVKLLPELLTDDESYATGTSTSIHGLDTVALAVKSLDRTPLKFLGVHMTMIDDPFLSFQTRIRVGQELNQLFSGLCTFHSLPYPQLVHTDDMRYSQNSINGTFGGSHANCPLMSLVSDLQDQRVGPHDSFLVLNAVEHMGVIYSLNNRRLWCLKTFHDSVQQELDVRIRVRIWPLAHGLFIDGQDVCQKFCKSLTTQNQGTSVLIRSDASGSAESAQGHGVGPCNLPAEPTASTELVEQEVAVVEEYVHDDEAAAPDEADGVIGEVLWASAVEHRIQNDCVFTENGGQATPDGLEDGVHSVVQLKFNKCHRQFLDALMTAPELAPIIEALGDAGHAVILLSKAKVFVHPDHYEGVVRAIDARGDRLFADHVIMEPEFELIVIKVVSKVAQPKPGSRSVIELAAASEGHASPSFDAKYEDVGQAYQDGSAREDEPGIGNSQLRVIRTFIDIKVPSSLCDGRSEKTAITY